MKLPQNTQNCTILAIWVFYLSMFFQVSTDNPIGNGNGLETATTGDHAYPSKTTDNMNPEVNEGNTPTSSTIKSYDHRAEKFVTSTQKSSKRETDMDFVDDIDDILSDDIDFGEYENEVNTTEEYYSNDGIEKVIVSIEIIFLDATPSPSNI